MNPFKREDHVFHSPDFQEVVKDAIRFFNGTPVYQIPPPEKFLGAGVYSLYFTGKEPIYEAISARNRTSYDLPIYVGKAVPSGWRQAREIGLDKPVSSVLYSRIREHGKSIDISENLSLSGFQCRFMILEKAESDLIGTIEAALIRFYRPLWNSFIDGFGNHDPGKGRYNQAKSEWDVLHPGRSWANRCLGKPAELHRIEAKLKTYEDTI